MSRNRLLVTIAVVALLSVASFDSLAGIWHEFGGTPNHVNSAKEIVIAECLSDSSPAFNGLVECEVVVVSVIKGERKTGKLILYSDGLRKGRSYMLTNFGNYNGKIDFATNGTLAVVELPPRFKIGSFKGKTPLEQVEAVFEARQIFVEWELRRFESEKKLLEKATSKKLE